MSTLHERLLAELKGWHIWAPPNAAVALSRQETSLRTVIELHAPLPCLTPCTARHEHVACRQCRPEDPFGPHWPCSTIEAIAEALEIGETP